MARRRRGINPRWEKRQRASASDTYYGVAQGSPVSITLPAPIAGRGNNSAGREVARLISATTLPPYNAPKNSSNTNPVTDAHKSRQHGGSGRTQEFDDLSTIKDEELTKIMNQYETWREVLGHFGNLTNAAIARLATLWSNKKHIDNNASDKPAATKPSQSDDSDKKQPINPPKEIIDDNPPTWSPDQPSGTMYWTWGDADSFDDSSTIFAIQKGGPQVVYLVISDKTANNPNLKSHILNDHDAAHKVVDKNLRNALGDLFITDAYTGLNYPKQLSISEDIQDHVPFHIEARAVDIPLAAMLEYILGYRNTRAQQLVQEAVLRSQNVKGTDPSSFKYLQDEAVWKWFAKGGFRHDTKADRNMLGRYIGGVYKTK